MDRKWGDPELFENGWRLHRRDGDGGDLRGAIVALSQASGQPALVAYVIDSDCAQVEAAAPNGATWSAMLNPEVAVESYEAPEPPDPEVVIEAASAWAGEAELSLDRAQLRSVLTAEFEFAEEAFAALLAGLGIHGLPEPEGSPVIDQGPSEASSSPVPKLDSRGVYAIARSVLGPVMKEAGFKHERGMLSWTRPQEGEHLTIWLQVSQYGFDPYRGSKFTVEFQLGAESAVGSGGDSVRFCRLLRAGELEVVRARQNRVIAGLPDLPAARLGGLSPDLRDYHRRPEPVYSPRDDVWFRYRSGRDIEAWSTYLAAMMPTAIERFLIWAQRPWYGAPPQPLPW